MAGGRSFLVGATFTLADVSSTLPHHFFNHACRFSIHVENTISKSISTTLQIVVYCTLLPIKDQLAASLKFYVDAITALAPVKKAWEAFTGSDDAAALKQVFLEDSKAFVSAQPKLPIPGQRNILVS